MSTRTDRLPLVIYPPALRNVVHSVDVIWSRDLMAPHRI